MKSTTKTKTKTTSTKTKAPASAKAATKPGLSIENAPPAFWEGVKLAAALSPGSDASDHERDKARAYIERAAYEKRDTVKDPGGPEALVTLAALGMASGEDGTGNAFLDGALRTLADDLEVLYHALANDEHQVDPDKLPTMIWRLSERAKAALAIAERMDHIERAAKTPEQVDTCVNAATARFSQTGPLTSKGVSRLRKLAEGVVSEMPYASARRHVDEVERRFDTANAKAVAS
jgi:hypothetical protein